MHHRSDAIISRSAAPAPTPLPLSPPLPPPPPPPPPAASHAHGAASATVAVAEIEEADDSAATTPRPSAQDYTCAICFELLLRPVVLSCGHQYCRGCWLRMLNHSDARAKAYLTGSASCPFRCRVRPVVPKVDQALASKLEALFEVEYAARASAIALPDEERGAAKVNAWAEAGCKLDRASEYATLEELEYARIPAPPPLRPMFNEATRSPPASDVLPTAPGPPAATVARRPSPRSVLRWHGRTRGLARVCGRLRSQISALLRCSKSRVSPL
jgi:hypothetical protein